jgi:excisionase family DNA binding protein
MEKLWTTGEVAQHLGIDEAQVHQLVRQGKLTAYKLGGQFLRFRPEQVELLKGDVSPPSLLGKPKPARHIWFHDVKDFFYFYDFYLISASLLALIAVYLIVVG